MLQPTLFVIRTITAIKIYFNNAATITLLCCNVTINITGIVIQKNIMIITTHFYNAKTTTCVCCNIAMRFRRNKMITPMYFGNLGTETLTY